MTQPFIEKLGAMYKEYSAGRRQEFQNAVSKQIIRCFVFMDNLNKDRFETFTYTYTVGPTVYTLLCHYFSIFSLDNHYFRSKLEIENFQVDRIFQFILDMLPNLVNSESNSNNDDEMEHSQICVENRLDASQ